MYHFIRVTSQKLFKNFSNDKKVDDDKEQIIDFCPKCNMTLADKKVNTLRKHDREHHPKTDKELVKNFYTKGAMPIIFLLFGIVIAVGFVFASGNISNYYWELSLTEEEENAYEFCKKLLEDYPKIGYFWEDNENVYTEKGEYILENLDDLKKCYYTLGITSLGSNEKRIEHYLSPEQ